MRLSVVENVYQHTAIAEDKNRDLTLCEAFEDSAVSTGPSGLRLAGIVTAAVQASLLFECGVHLHI